MIDLELHCHTRYSPDSLVRLPDLIARAREVGLTKLAITDHSEIEGALLAYEMAPDLIIVGEEAMTDQGEILCYYLTELIPYGTPLQEAIDMVHAQGGICGPSHPLDPRRHGVGVDNLLNYASQFDFIEVFNARTRDRTKNEMTQQITQNLQRPMICCSDAHTLQEVGISRTRFVEDVTCAAEFLRELQRGEIVPHYSSPMTSAGSLLATIAHKVGLDRRTRG